MKNQYDERGKLITNKNHIPSKSSYKLAGFKVSDYIGSAHIMLPDDHARYISTGSSNDSKIFRELEARYIRDGKFMEAFDINAKAIKNRFGDKYNEGVAKAREQYEKEVVPILQKQYNNRK